ncbi:hypothetical protein [uncultured Clostridium sp.]|uniref:hypothetical protein n=1 Tax=uncultured Clostridium sp. TaxID=59620 RepID=UPI0028E6FD43|nr:hypothetical protein [uncultured Clostridium sp.]
MKTTINYGLKKPEGTDVVNIEDLNYNADVIDQKIKEVDTKASNIKVPVTSVNEKTGAVTLAASDVGAVPTGRKINNKPLSTDIALSATDIKTSSGITVESQLAQIKTDIGSETLQTTKKNLKGAINEVFQSGVDAKNSVVTALTSSGADVTTDSTWEEISNAIPTVTGDYKVGDEIYFHNIEQSTPFGTLVKEISVADLYEGTSTFYRSPTCIVFNGDGSRLYFTILDYITDGSLKSKIYYWDLTTNEIKNIEVNTTDDYLSVYRNVGKVKVNTKNGDVYILSDKTRLNVYNSNHKIIRTITKPKIVDFDFDMDTGNIFILVDTGSSGYSIEIYNKLGVLESVIDNKSLGAYYNYIYSLFYNKTYNYLIIRYIPSGTDNYHKLRAINLNDNTIAWSGVDAWEKSYSNTDKGKVSVMYEGEYLATLKGYKDGYYYDNTVYLRKVFGGSIGSFRIEEDTTRVAMSIALYSNAIYAMGRDIHMLNYKPERKDRLLDGSYANRDEEYYNNVLSFNKEYMAYVSYGTKIKIAYCVNKYKILNKLML